LLALNALFILMKEYNLSVVNSPSSITVIHAAIGIILRFMLVYVPSSTKISCMSNTEVGFSGAQSSF